MNVNHTNTTYQRLRGIEQSYPEGSQENIRAKYMAETLAPTSQDLEPIYPSETKTYDLEGTETGSHVDFEKEVQQIVSDAESLSHQSMSHLKLYGSKNEQEEAELTNTANLFTTVMSSYRDAKEPNFNGSITKAFKDKYETDII